MVNYELGKIYKIVCNETGLMYIGCTAQEYLTTRLGGHIRNYKKYLNDKYTFVYSFKVLECGNFDIILIENYPCKDKYELQAKERHYIETMDCVNKVIPNRTPKEHYEDNKDKIKEQTKQYYLLNKEKLQEQHKIYTREYYKNNKEKKKEQNRQYYLRKKAEKHQVITE